MTVPLTSAQLLAAEYIESVYVAASTSSTPHIDDLALWIDPDNNSNPKYVYIRDAILNGAVYKTHLTGSLVDAQRQYYKDQTGVLMPAVEAAARLWAYKALNDQEVKLGRLRLFINVWPRALSIAAKEVREYALNVTLPVTTAAQAKEITGQSGGSGTMTTRLLRVQYMNAARKCLEQAAKEDRDPYRYLYQLMVHPRGVRIVDAFAKSADTGRVYADETINECLTASIGVRASLNSDKDLVWRFPPAISAGVAMLGLTSGPAITRFSLAWATTKKEMWESALEIAGNVIFALDLVGGPQLKAVGAIVNFVLAAIGTAVSFLRDVEQDQAATASSFAGNVEKLSEGSRSIGTILQGAVTIIAALAVPGAISTITGRTAKTGLKAASALEHVPDTPNPRGLTRIETDVEKAKQRGLPLTRNESLTAEGNRAKVATATAGSESSVVTVDEAAKLPGPSVQDVDSEAVDLMLKDSEALARMQRADPLAGRGDLATSQMTQNRAAEIVTSKKFEYRGVAALASLGRRDRAIRFINVEFAIDTTTLKGVTRVTALGFPRNSKAFWRAMCSDYPQLFSPANKRSILQDDLAPYVDDFWLKYHPTQRLYKGDKLVHHHIEQGPWAAGIPEKVHRELYPEFHPITNPDVLE